MNIKRLMDWDATVACVHRRGLPITDSIPKLTRTRKGPRKPIKKL